MRTTLTLLLALGFLVGVPSVAAGPGDDCDTYRAESVPLLSPSIRAGEVQLCDEDEDGAFDTVAFETNYVYNEGVVSVTNEEKQRSDHQDEETQAEARLTPGTPTRTIVYQRLAVEDEGNDGQTDAVYANGGVYGTPATTYIVDLFDEDGNHAPDRGRFLVCSAVCVGPRDVPDVPERIDLPDTIVELPVVGHVP